MQMQVKAPWPGWEISDYLGGGSFGAVYKIQRNISGVTEYAAMKMIPVPKEPEEVRDLLNSGYDRHSINQRYKADLDDIRKEYSMMALLKGNANVVYCDDICDEPNPDGIGWKLYIRMELLTPLTKALADPYREAQVVKVGMDLCNALAACKRKNIIHRDIKPANIMVAEDGNYKLGDFGVAKTLEGTSGGTKTGTYNFMAPEVYNNRPYGQSADIYSLGMVLYWMLNQRCGPFLPLPPTVPTASQMENAKERRFGGEQLPPPANGSQALKQIVLRACAFDPAQRYTTPEELYADLAEVSKTQHEEHSYHPASSATSSADSTMGDRSNSWENEYDKTQGSVYGGGGTQGGTVGGTVGGGGNNGSHIGPFDIRGQLHVTTQELATGCVKPFTTGSGKKINVTVKAGTAVGTVLRLAGAGQVNAATGAKGDAYVTVLLQEKKSAADSNFWGDSAPSEPASKTVATAPKAQSGGVVWKVVLALLAWPTIAAITGLWPIGFLMFIHPVVIIVSHNKKQKASPKVSQSNNNSTLNPAAVQAIKTHLASGNNLAAIKVYRDATGVELAKAKAAVEKIANQINCK